jgi:peroxiredoxin
MFLKISNLLLLALILVTPNHAFAFEESDDPVNSLESQWRKARQIHWSEIETAKTSEEREVLKAKNPDQTFASRFLELAGKFDSNSDAAAEALIYAIYADTDGPIGDQAAELLARNHVDSQRLELFFNSGPHPSDASGEKLFRTIAERSVKKSFRGQAMKILADLLKDSKPDEAEKLYQQVIQKYAGEKSFEDFKQTLGPQAQHGLFYVQNLGIGKTAPEINGKDVNGKEIKLSDYKGKVVVICFCSEFCVPCRELYPYWRSLVERMKAKPFALIGINPDSKAVLLKVVRRENFTWPILWDEGGGDASIRSQWYVQGWPNIFLIDAKGIIRQHWIGSPGEQILNQRFEELVKEAE